MSFFCLSTAAAESFLATGLMVTERNWLEVYPWAKWGGNNNLPAFIEGNTFMPSELTLKQVWRVAALLPPKMNMNVMLQFHHLLGGATLSQVAHSLT